MDKWTLQQFEAAGKSMAELKTKIRELQRTRDRQLQAVANEQRKYGREYVQSRSREIQSEAKVKAEALVKQARSIVEAARPQQEFFSREDKLVSSRLVAAPTMPSFEAAGVLTNLEKFMLQSSHQQLALLAEMAEDFRRLRLEKELASAPVERIMHLISSAVATGNFGMLGAIKQAASNRSEAAIKVALLEAEREIKLPESDRQAMAHLNDIESLYHAVESSQKEIVSEGREQDLVQRMELAKQKYGAPAEESA